MSQSCIGVNCELDKPKKIKFDFEKVLKSKCDASLSMQHQLVEEKLIASRKASFQRNMPLMETPLAF
jgi:hypothetical protein